MVLNAVAQAFRNAEEIKQKIIEEVTNTPLKTLHLAQLQKAYQNILLLDLDYALDKKVEQDLWNFGFKNQIEFLQNNTKDKKNPRRSESQILLSWVLQSATGFYISLLHQICKSFQLELPFRYHLSYIVDDVNVPNNIRQPQLSSCWYICQHCLVHLGDLARYSRQPHNADSFYRQALNVSPRNGQPYNQLGLLRAARGDRLGAAYYHARGLAVGGPFPPAANNLTRTLAAGSEISILKKDKFNDGKNSSEIDILKLSNEARLNTKFYINNYIALHHQIQSPINLENIKQCVAELNSTLIALVATDEFDSDTLLKMCCIDLYALYSITEDGKINYSELTNDEEKVVTLIMELIAGSLTALVLPAHTRAPEETISYPALSAIKILLEWIRLNPEVLQHPSFVSRPQIWPGFSTLLINLQDSIKSFSGEQHNTVPLAEDDELQGFLPIDAAFSELKFSQCRSRHINNNVNNGVSELSPEEINTKMAETLQTSFEERNKFWEKKPAIDDKEVKMDSHFFNCLRAYRLTLLGKWLSTYQKEIGVEYFTVVNDPIAGFTISSTAQNSIESNPDIMKTIQELSILREKRLSESYLQKNADANSQDSGDLSDADNKIESSSIKITSNSAEKSLAPPIVISEADFKEKVREKRAGILKPQGSLEKARGEKILSRSNRIDVISPEPFKLSNENPNDISDIQDTGSSSSTVSQDGAICTDISSLLDTSIFIDQSLEKKNFKKVRTNVAMQAIMRKQEESVKQVKFLTPATTPDSITEQFTIPPLETKSNLEVKKIIQPKVMKSLNSIPMNRKTGGILSLKDKSAGYPHLVNTIPASNTESVKPEIDKKITETENPVDSKPIDITPVKVEKQKPTSDVKTVVPEQLPKVERRESYNKKFTPQTTWDDRKWNAGWGLFNQHPQADKLSNAPSGNPWKPDMNTQNLNIGQNNQGCYSYFPQKVDSGSITLPVVNPKEIDVRSVTMQRQKGLHQPGPDHIQKHNYYPNMQYDEPNMYNYWQSCDNMHKDPNAMNKINNMPPRFANLIKNNPMDFRDRVQNNSNFGNMQNDRSYMSDMNVPNTTGWWRHDNINSNYNAPKPDFPIYPPNPNQHPRMYNMPQPNQNSMYPSNIFSGERNIGPYNPYAFGPNQNSYNPELYSNAPKNLMGKQPNLKNPIGSEMSADNNYRNQYGMSNADPLKTDSPFMKDLHDDNRADKLYKFNVEIPEFIPKQSGINKGASSNTNFNAAKDVNAPTTPNTNIFSPYDGPESPWKNTNNDINAQQSLWPDSSQSPLEKLLEQQKQFK